jgi:RNA polymerase sigma factor (sigma-70 family)
VQDVVGQIYREHASALTARLVRTFGVRELDLVEALVQDTFVVALEVWPTRGIPDAPLAWLTTVARNAARDRLRRRARFHELEPDVVAWLDVPPEPDEARFAAELPDEQLRMMFVACHPALPVEMRLPLVLRTLCGFETIDIARAMFATEDAIDKRLVRARARLREAGAEFELPAGERLVERLDSVLGALYLLFSEGYHAHSGELVVRADLCHEAIRLGRVLAAHPLTAAPRTSALLALFHLQSARLDARHEHGRVVPISHQDRSRWDRAAITEGLVHLEAASRGTALSTWHLQAAIAACHALAPTFADTRWSEVVRLYDRLRIVDDSPVVALNRAIAVSYRDGPDAGLTLIDELATESRFRAFALLFAARGEMLARAGRRDEAISAYESAVGLAGTAGERAFLEERIERLRTA